MRLFFGIGIPEQRGIVTGWLNLLNLPGKARMVQPANYHITLLFLGESDSNQFDKAIKAGKAAARIHSLFPISARGWGAFPSPNRPRVLFVALDDSCGMLKSLNHTLAQSLALGIDAKNFHPHITVARLNQMEPLAGLSEPPQFSLVIAGFTLFSSHLTPRGPIYREEAVFPLEHLAKSE